MQTPDAPRRGGARPLPACSRLRALWLGALAALPAGAAPPADPCRGHGTVLLVRTASHEMRQCEDGRSRRTWRVALGSGGIDKRREGDAKTPLGSYPLGRPRPSQQFGIFIPVGYPTPEQAQRGYTGSAIGVHGPARAWRHLGALNTSTDWTLGCIAVASDATIEEIARWVRDKQVSRVVLL
ncbi:L,D-transpeptidase family protein [Aquabacterium sp. A7-Y]|uniref:L,D-transpeptidase family protein n=1 Tax=Aquabacterium sp. A7-Y TaxID=1349605 RepID=UPI00223E5DD7|nr:L,D-transpeptidase family protein [Aquabacterium sp. A7-Y]MCW7541056.1 L,D-transpeptidase family protein [Aquabacterium sp. A7-Y]